MCTNKGMVPMSNYSKCPVGIPLTMESISIINRLRRGNGVLGYNDVMNSVDEGMYLNTLEI